MDDIWLNELKSWQAVINGQSSGYCILLNLDGQIKFALGEFIVNIDYITTFCCEFKLFTY